jgi:hypothetical protein
MILHLGSQAYSYILLSTIKILLKDNFGNLGYLYIWGRSGRIVFELKINLPFSPHVYRIDG